jgi:hypothetical protein
MCGLVDVLDVGFAVLQADMQIVRPGTCAVTVKLAGAGLVARNDWIDRVLDRLELTEEIACAGADRPRLRRATGTCPGTGANVRFASLPAEGVLFAIEWVFAVEGVADAGESVDARQARAWVIHDDEVACESLARRLQRLGWATSKFDGPSAAARRLRAMPNANARPALVVVAECATVSPGAVQCLRPYLPAWTAAIYAVLPGSPTLARPDLVPGFDVRVLPLSPVELQAVTLALSPEADELERRGDAVPSVIRRDESVLGRRDRAGLPGRGHGRPCRKAAGLADPACRAAAGLCRGGRNAHLMRHRTGRRAWNRWPFFRPVRPTAARRGSAWKSAAPRTRHVPRETRRRRYGRVPPPCAAAFLFLQHADGRPQGRFARGVCASCNVLSE